MTLKPLDLRPNDIVRAIVHEGANVRSERDPRRVPLPGRSREFPARDTVCWYSEKQRFFWEGIELVAEANDWNSQVVEEFRANGGKVGGPFEGAPMLLLHCTGAKSGKERVHPLMYQTVGSSLAIFASKRGAPSNPDWYYNLLVLQPHLAMGVVIEREKLLKPAQSC